MEAKSEVSSPKNSTKTTSLVTSFLAGALSGACNTVLLQPFDLIKTRIQQSPHSTIWAQTRLVARSEGPRGFWSGVTPSLWRTVPGVGLYFTSVHLLTGLLSDADQQLSPLQSLSVGFLARVIAGTALMPLSLIKTRWEAGGAQFAYKGAGIVGAVKTILRLEGRRGLMLGLLPTILRDAPYSAVYLMFYNKLKAVTASTSGTSGASGSLTHFSCGLLAGALATLLVQPADVVKTELQLRQERVGHWRVIRQIYSDRAVGGFFVGLGPRVVRKSLMSALAWSVYERATYQMLTKS